MPDKCIRCVLVDRQKGTDQMDGAGVQNHVLKKDDHSYTNGETLEVSVGH